MPSGITVATYRRDGVREPGDANAMLRAQPAPPGRPAVLSHLRERYRGLDWLLTLNDRFVQVSGSPLSAALALAGFISLFPLLFVGIAIVGFFSAGDVTFADDVVDQLGLEGDAARLVTDTVQTAEASRRAATVIGFLGLVWAGLRVVGALDQSLNATWQVTGRGLASRLYGVAWLAGAGALFLATVSLGGLVNLLPGPAVVATVGLGLAANTALFAWMFRTLTNVSLPWRVFAPGAIVGAVGLEVLKLVGGVYVPRAVADSSALYGSLGVVFALLAWLILAARLVVYASLVNVLRYEAQHGTVTVDIEVPRIGGEVPLEANRGGAVSDSAPRPGDEGD
jgi:membrane protein